LGHSARLELAELDQNRPVANLQVARGGHVEELCKYHFDYSVVQRYFVLVRRVEEVSGAVTEEDNWN